MNNTLHLPFEIVTEQNLLVLLFGISIIILVFIIFTYLIFDKKIQKRTVRKKLYLTLDELMAVTLADNHLYKNDYLVHEVKTIIHQYPLKQQIVIDYLLMLLKNFRGGSKDKVIELYITLRLDHNSYKKTTHSDPFEVARGLYELAMFEQNHHSEVTKIHLISRSKMIRIEAQIAYLKIHGFNALPEILERPSDLSNLLLIKFVEILKYKPFKEEDEILRYLNHRNYYARKLVLILIRQFNLVQLIKNVKTHQKIETNEHVLFEIEKTLIFFNLSK